MTDTASGPFSFLMTRRAVLMATAGLAAAAMLPGLPAFAQRKGAPARAEVPVSELMEPGPLPELSQGKADAPVTIVEYASLTCGHCAAFHNTVFPKIKEKYIDSGQVRFIMREFPLDNLAAAAAMLTRCAGGEKTYPLIEVLFKQQEQWAFVRGNPVPELFKVAKQAGFTQESFDKCLTDQKLLEQVTSIRSKASDKFGVNSTPTFFINGKRLQEAPTVEAFDKALAPLLKS
ncbi:MAG TPA: DsbA family protein [Hyphomicrobiaceae bacterium]